MSTCHQADGQTIPVSIDCCSVADPDPNPDPRVLGLLDPNPDLLVRGMAPDPDLNPSIFQQK